MKWIPAVWCLKPFWFLWHWVLLSRQPFRETTREFQFFHDWFLSLSMNYIFLEFSWEVLWNKSYHQQNRHHFPKSRFICLFYIWPILSGQPLLSGHFSMSRGWPLNRGQTVHINKYGESGSPCQTLRLSGKYDVEKPLFKHNSVSTPIKCFNPQCKWWSKIRSFQCTNQIIPFSEVKSVFKISC